MARVGWAGGCKMKLLFVPYPKPSQVAIKILKILLYYNSKQAAEVAWMGTSLQVRRSRNWETRVQYWSLV